MLNYARRLIGMPSPQDAPIILAGLVRSPQWPAVRRRWIKDHPNCCVCEIDRDLDVHHIEPFHVNPSRELDPSNFATCCTRCHLLVGHLGRWDSWNREFLRIAREIRMLVMSRPLSG
jgi:5-methylcytosine-specific restriction endonuclease McrA